MGSGAYRGDRLIGDRRILGAVIAGGRASRFGSDKRAALLDDVPLIEHAIGAIAGRVDAIVIAGAPWRDLLHIDDRPSPGLGPLGGVAAALAHAGTVGCSAVLTIGCDMPRLPEGLLDLLLVRMPSYCVDAPILGFWPAALADPLIERLAGGGERSIKGWARSIGAVPIVSPVPLANVNTPSDLVAL